MIKGTAAEVKKEPVKEDRKKIAADLKKQKELDEKHKFIFEFLDIVN